MFLLGLTASALLCVLIVLRTHQVLAFQPSARYGLASTSTASKARHASCLLASRRTITRERTVCSPMILDVAVEQEEASVGKMEAPPKNGIKELFYLPSVATATAAAVTAWSMALDNAMAAANSILSEGIMSPQDFQPVCATSDGFYRFLQSATLGIVGKENFVEYGPLIAGGLLRIRLELCVIESFFSEAVAPFIAQNGISWILPLHETVETFLAGVIFALATTFILVGSSKIVSVIVTYADFLVGVPSRLFGGFSFDRAMGKPVTLDIGFGPFKKRVIGPPEKDIQEIENVSLTSPIKLVILVVSGAVKTFGQASGLLREALEAIDLFVGRYLVLMAFGYILLKFLHFKVFPDFP